MIKAGHIGPIHPIKTFRFDEIGDALGFIRGGSHIGKVVISNQGQGDMQVPIRPALKDLSLRADVSYLIVGGLKGLCGNLAIHMARHGARHIIVCSRSGIEDEQSRKTVLSCMAYGCDISQTKGDVGDLGFVRKTFSQASPRIAGVLQGAMVLRVRCTKRRSQERHVALFLVTSPLYYV